MPPRIPVKGEVWVKSSYKNVHSAVGRVIITHVLGTGLKATVMYTRQGGTKAGELGKVSADSFIKLYEFEPKPPTFDQRLPLL